MKVQVAVVKKLNVQPVDKLCWAKLTCFMAVLRGTSTAGLGISSNQAANALDGAEWLVRNVLSEALASSGWCIPLPTASKG